MENESLDFLVQETFRRLDDSQTSLDEKTTVEARTIIAPPSPGVFYTLYETGDTFVIRGLASKNLASDYHLIVNDPTQYPSLKLTEESHLEEQLLFFPCSGVEEAKYLKKSLFHQRFPLKEELICNVSDPAYSWWMKEEENNIMIYFNLSKTQDMHDLIKLGPLGDRNHFKKIMKGLSTTLNHYFPIMSISMTGHFFSISSDQHNNAFQSFKALFRDGFIWDQWRVDLRDLAYFATARSFWLKIMDQVHEKFYFEP